MAGTTAEPRAAASKPVVSSSSTSSSAVSSPRSEKDPAHPYSTCKRAIGTHIVGQQKPLLDKTQAAHVSTRRAEQDEEEEDEVKKKHEVGGVTELPDSSGRCQGIKPQEQVQAQELAVAASTMESGKLELQLQLETAEKAQQRDAATIQELSAELATTVARLAEGEERGRKWEEEKKRLIEQVDALEDDKQKLEKKVEEVEGLGLVVQMKVDDLRRQLREARQEQEELKLEFCGDFLSASLNQVRRGDDDEMGVRATGKSVVARMQELEIEIGGWKAEVGASAEKWRLERQELKKQIDELTLANQEASVELAEVAQMREHLLEHVGIDLTCESMESFLGAQNNTIQKLIAQLSAIKASHTYGNSVETEDYCVRLEELQTKYDMMASKRLEQDKTIAELCAELNCKAVHNSFSHPPEHSKRWRACEPIVESEHVSRLVESTWTQELKSSDDFSATKSKIEALVLALQIDEPASSDGGIKPCHTSRLKELAKCLEQAQDLLVSAAEPKQRRQDEVTILQERIHRHETQNRLLLAKLEGCECALKAQGFAVKKADNASDDAGRRALSTDDAGFVVTNGEIVDRSDGLSCDLEDTLDATRTRLHGACKAENLEMTSEAAKKSDGVLELEQDHDGLLEAHQTSMSELEVMVEQLDVLKRANQALSSEIASKTDDLRYHYEAFTMQKEDFRCIIFNLESALFRAEMENGKIKRDFDDAKTENDALSERIGRLHSLANGKTESDEGLATDREVEKLRSSLVQAKVNCLEQKQQLTALEKKLVDVSKPGGFACTISNASLDAERREFEAALIEMIEMEKKLQVAYEAKQGLESTLQERMEAKAELEDKLCAAEDKIAELEQQLEQKVALIATIEEQLQSVEEEREKLSDEFEKTKSKLERSIGKLEEKEIESEAFKTTANMLKDERSRLFSEIALLKDDIAKSEVQKAALANSQELANEELEDQLNELADRIAEIEAEKQDLRARLEDTVIRSEEDILQLRGRLYRLEEEKSSIDDENLSLERTIEDMEVELDTLEEQKTLLEAANVLSSEQVTLLEKRLEEASTEIALVSDEKNELQVQLTQSIVEKDGLSRSVSELQEKACAEKAASKQVAVELESQIAANKILDSKIRLLKQMAEKALQSVKAKDEELLEAMSRAANLVEERDSVRVSLNEKESAVEASLVESERLQQQVEELTKDLESCRIKLLEEASASEVQISKLTRAEAELSESLESVRKDLAGAESCVLILVEERDNARKELSAKDLKIEMMKTAQGEFELSVQKLENELGALRRISSTEAEKRDRIISDLEMSKDYAEKRAHELQDTLLRTEELHQSLREKLTESEWRIGTLETERDATRSSLDEKESTHETLSALQEDLQKSVRALESELKELHESSSAELAAANETIKSLETAETEGAEVLASLRLELAEAEACVMVLVDERDAIKKALSKRELTLEVLSCEHGELQLKSQSVKTELDVLRQKSEANARAAEEVVQTLKEALEHTTGSLELAQKELAASELRVASLSAECEAVSTRMIGIDTERNSLSLRTGELEHRIKTLETKIMNSETRHAEALKTSEEMNCALKLSEAEAKKLLESVQIELCNSNSHAKILADECDSLNNTLTQKENELRTFSSHNERLQKHIESLERELQEVRSQRESDACTAEEKIRSLKESEAQLAETLEATRQKLSETDARAVCIEEEHEAARQSLSSMEAQREAERKELMSLQERIESLESELQEVRSQRESDACTAEEKIRSLKESEAQLAETLEATRQKLSETDARAVCIEEEHEAARQSLSSMEAQREAERKELMSLQERIESLESELQEVRSQRESDACTAEEKIRSLKESEAQLAETLEATRQKLSETDARAVCIEEEHEAARQSLSSMEAQREAERKDLMSLQKRIESLESELQEVRSQRESDACTAEEKIRSLKESEAQLAETLEATRQKLSETDARAVCIEEEHEAARQSLSSMEAQREAERKELMSLQERIESLESELQEVRSQRESDACTAEEKIRSLKESEAQLAETLEATRQKLSETDARAVCIEEEHEAARQSLSSMEAQREAERKELMSLQERIESLESELQEVRSQRESDACTAEEKIRSLKESEAQLAETLEATRQKLSETDARAVCIEEEHEAARQSLSSMEAQREAERKDLMSLQKRIESLESELQEVRSQRESDACTAEEKIRSLKESEAQLAETLEATRQKLSETDARAACAEEELKIMHASVRQKELRLVELEDTKVDLVANANLFESRVRELESELEERALKLLYESNRAERHEREWAQIEVQLRDEVGMVEARSAKEIGLLKKEVASLSESSSSALAEASSVRERRIIEDKKHIATIARKDEVILTLKKKLGEVMAAYKRVKGRLQELQDTLTQSTKLNDCLKVSNDELNAQRSKSLTELDALKCEFTLFRKQSVAEGDKLRQAGELFAASEAQLVAQLDQYKKRVLAYDDELDQMRRQHDIALHEQKETLLLVSAANAKVAELQESLAVLTETAERKEAEIHSMAKRMRHIEQERTKTVSVCEEMDRTREAERVELEAQLSMANESIATLRSASIANVGLQTEFVSQLEHQIGKLQQKVEAEKEEADAARAALGTYRKRAHTALKKASSENRLNLDKSAEIITKLEKEAGTAKDRIRVLETELAEARRRIKEVVSAEDAGAEKALETLKAEKHVQETSLRLEIDSLKKEVMRLEDALENVKAPLESQIKQLVERNEALDHEIVSLKEEGRIKNKSVEQEVLAKEDEISDLSKQLHAALAAATSLATNEAGRRSYSPTYSPTDKERRSTASSSRSFEYDGNNNSLYRAVIEEEHELIAAAFDDSCASKIATANRAEQQLEISVDVDGEVMRLELLLKDVQARSRVFERKYEEAIALLNEANQEKQRLQELDDRATQEINIEYLKNVIIKYIGSQVPGEKEQLVPVIATLLSFSPQEHHQVRAAHSKANEEGTGLFGGVFSLFGGGGASAPAPKPLAALHNVKPSPRSAKSKTTGVALGSKDKNGVLLFGSDPSDDEESLTPLNPFTA